MSLSIHSLDQRLLPLTLALALVGTSLLGCGRGSPTATAAPQAETALEHAVKHLDPTYVCPMHPQVVSAQPGECPICGMDLVPKEADGAEAHEPGAADGPQSVTISDAVVNQLGVRTAEVRRGTLSRQIEGFGAFLGSASRGYRPANRASDPNLADPGGAPSILVAQVFEREAPLVHQGQTARVHFPALGSTEWMGTVTTLETQISPTTRTLQFRVAVDLAGASVPGGMTAMVTLEVDPMTDVLLVPREAVILTGKGTRVIVDQGEGRFEPREIAVEDLGEDEILVRSGLSEGERVVVSAQFLLDSEANLQAGLRRLAGQRPEANAMSEGTSQ